MLRFSGWLCAVLVLCTAVNQVDAAVYYVRERGNDRNDGKSAAKAFRQIATAATRVRAGDTVYVGRGTYDAFKLERKAASKGAPIRFIADFSGSKTGDSGQAVIRDGRGTRHGLVYMDRCHHIHFDGFVLKSTFTSMASC